MTEERDASAMQHEAGDRAFVAGQHFSDFVVDHPFVQQHDALKTMAEEIEARMAELYQAIWKISDGPDRTQP